MSHTITHLYFKDNTVVRIVSSNIQTYLIKKQRKECIIFAVNLTLREGTICILSIYRHYSIPAYGVISINLVLSFYGKLHMWTTK